MIDDFAPSFAAKTGIRYLSGEESPLYTAHPSMFRNRPLLFLTGLALPVGFVVTPDYQMQALGGILALVVAASFLNWWLTCLTTTLTVTDRRLVLRRGILGRDQNEVFIKDIRNVRLRQSPLQRVFSVGSLGVSSSGQADIEIQVDGIPHPDRVLELIHRHRV
jgi:uncharacterized membrane protein YdbT with pleckstrin-like domain